MPAPTSDLTARISFTLPVDRLDHDESIYLQEWTTSFPQRPSELVNVPVVDLRADLDVAVPVKEQLAVRGFAVTRHTSATYDGIPTKEGTARYLDETAEWVPSGATLTLGWYGKLSELRK